MDPVLADWLKWIAIAAIGGVLTAAVLKGWDSLMGLLPWRRPDFLWTRDVNGDWWLQRTRRRTALAVSVGLGGYSTSDGRTLPQEATASGRSLGDVPHRKRYQAARDGEEVWVTWIERDRRWYSRSEHLADSIHRVEVKRRRLRDGTPASTVD
jgi:hypothetical protein